MSRVLPVLCFAVAVVCGCGHVADVKLRNGRMVRGDIVGGDADAIYLHRETSSSSRAKSAHEVRVERAAIADIEHPGDVSVWVGVGLLAASVVATVSTAVVLSQDHGPDPWGTETSSRSLLINLSATLFTVGGIVFVTSLNRGAESREAMSNPPPNPR